MTDLARLVRDAEGIASRFGHTAVALAALINDDRDEDTRALRDLEPHEERFLIAVHQITSARHRAIGEARRSGLDEKAMLAVEHHARTIMNNDLSDALNRLATECVGAAIDKAERVGVQWAWQQPAETEAA